MNLLFSPNAGLKNSREAGFTMVEIAISLAVIGFALVAIIGVLPAGLRVQTENRQETIINQDATVFMEAIRCGGRRADDLTNYVIAITNCWQRFGIDGTVTNTGGSNYNGHTFLRSYTSNPTKPDNEWCLRGSNIVGLLTTPKRKFVFLQDGTTYFYSNYVVATVRSISGAVVEKPPQNNETILDSAFTYQIHPEIVPVPQYGGEPAYGKDLQANLHELRLTFRWPVLPNGSVGHGKQTFRTLVSGIVTNDPKGMPLYFFIRPEAYAKAP